MDTGREGSAELGVPGTQGTSTAGSGRQSRQGTCDDQRIEPRTGACAAAQQSVGPSHVPASNHGDCAEHWNLCSSADDISSFHAGEKTRRATQTDRGYAKESQAFFSTARAGAGARAVCIVA